MEYIRDNGTENASYFHTSFRFSIVPIEPYIYHLYNLKLFGQLWDLLRFPPGCLSLASGYVLQ